MSKVKVTELQDEVTGLESRVAELTLELIKHRGIIEYLESKTALAEECGDCED